ncbi:hypothetical protein GCM10010518_34630 [Kitasatospora cinereorecta]
MRLGRATAEDADAWREERAEDEGEGGQGRAEYGTGRHGEFLLLMTIWDGAPAYGPSTEILPGSTRVRQRATHDPSANTPARGSPPGRHARN